MPREPYTSVASLPLRVDDYALERLEEPVSSDFTRVSTIVRLHGAGVEGVGEDVTYTAEDHDRLQARGRDLRLAGSFDLRAFSARLDEVPLFDRAPALPAARDYRRWAFESAALDLALRQAGTTLHAVLGRTPRPVRFVASLRLDPPSLEPIETLLAAHPTLRFKVDPTPDWDREFCERLAALDCVEVVDLKGAYSGTPVDNPADAELYARVVDTFPDAVIEDPALDARTEPVLRPHRARIAWDAPIHSVADLEALPFPPRVLNVKPSRFGTVERLLASYAWCEAHDVLAYGGGQFELGPGRGQIQYLASLFHPDSPNDVAPSSYNRAQRPTSLPGSPLPAIVPELGFRGD